MYSFANEKDTTHLYVLVEFDVL